MKANEFDLLNFLALCRITLLIHYHSKANDARYQNENGQKFHIDEFTIHLNASNWQKLQNERRFVIDDERTIWWCFYGFGGN